MFASTGQIEKFLQMRATWVIVLVTALSGGAQRVTADDHHKWGQMLKDNIHVISQRECVVLDQKDWVELWDKITRSETLEELMAALAEQPQQQE